MANTDLFEYSSQAVLHSEEDVKMKVIMPYLKKLGYSEKEMRFENPIKVQVGRKSVTIFSDIEIIINGRTEIVIDTKEPKKTLSKKDLLQSLSYAKLIETPPARYGFTSNGIDLVGSDTIIGSDVSSIPSKNELIALIQSKSARILTDFEIREVKSTLLTIVDAKDLFKVIADCKKIIENQALIRSDQSFKEMTKILLVKMNEERRAIVDKSKNRLTVKWLHDAAKINSRKITELGIFKELFKEAKEQYPGIYAKSDDNFLIQNNDALLHVIEKIEPYSFLGTGDDIKGAVYEIFLKATLRGEFDQYFTPRTIVDFIVELANPTYNDVFVDPAAGSGGFLIKAFTHVNKGLKESHLSENDYAKAEKYLVQKNIWGQEADYDLHVLTKINLIMHGDGWNNIYQGDSLSTKFLPENFFDIVLENPPFTTKYFDENILKKYEQGIGRKSQELDILFVEKSLKLLKPGGRLFIVLPEGLLNVKTYNPFRKWLLEKSYLSSSFSLPAGTFQPFGRSASKTAIIEVIKKGQNVNQPEYVFVGNLKNIGYDTGKSTFKEIPENDFPKVIESRKNFFKGIKKVGKSEVAWVKSENVSSERLDGREYLSIVNQISAKSTVSLGDLFDVEQPSEKLISEEEYQYVQVPYFSDEHGALQRVDSVKGKDINSSSLIMIPSKGIYFTRINPRKKRIGVIPSSIKGSICISNEVYLLSWKNNPYLSENERFLIIPILRSEKITQSILLKSTGSSSSRARISKDSLKEIQIPIQMLTMENKEKKSNTILNAANMIWESTTKLNNLFNL